MCQWPSGYSRSWTPTQSDHGQNEVRKQPNVRQFLEDIVVSHTNNKEGFNLDLVKHSIQCHIVRS